MKTKRRRDLLHKSQHLKGLFTAQVLTSMMMFKFTLRHHLRISKTHLFTIAQYLLLMAAVIVTARTGREVAAMVYCSLETALTAVR
jgi:hypothetical protein